MNDRAPVVMCKHNPPYYRDYVEQYGMEKGRRDSLAFAYDVPETREEADRILGRKRAKKTRK